MKMALMVRRQKVKTVQLNLTYRCNQMCTHCHVESGPNRTEDMDRTTADRVLDLLRKEPEISTVDLTGGAPEMSACFRYLIIELSRMKKKIINRTNLTVLLEEDQKDTAQFLADQGVELFASLPCYTKENVERQRGEGVFEKSLSALRALNALQYGIEGSGLVLSLVYNPDGPHLPGNQADLRADYAAKLENEFDIRFNNLLTITNMPINRFARVLEKNGEAEKYMELLKNNFNPDVVDSLMCRELVSVAWDGQLYDCDFNQMLGIPAGRQKRTIWDVDRFSEIGERIAVADHCFGCTAGEGSSCGGALVTQSNPPIEQRCEVAEKS